MGALALTPRKKYQEPFAPLMPHVETAIYNDLASAQEVIDDATCAVFVEPLQGEGGVHLANHDFLRGLRETCDANHSLLVFDEVQCGLGRTGNLWAHEPSGVTPDIMTLAKPLGGGLPIGAALVTEAVARAMAPGDHGSTFAANCLIAALACVVFDRVSDPTFLMEVGEKGIYLRNKLRDLQGKGAPLAEIRGQGLIWGLETPLMAADVVSAGYEEGIILTTAGEHVVRLVPPLVIERQHIDEMVPALERALRKAGKTP